ncbi:MAG: hypoxanthine phosphoribosyltransferase [Candidatus Cloacimonetes bacterium]|nr:hypoxanthine phosphoribosyltransferase [Candidatus Cloacimonadota bacterium]
MNQDISTILYGKEQIQQEINRISAAISRDYEGKNPLLLCVLKGALIFLADIVRGVTIPMEIDFISISSYGSETVSSGKITERQKPLTNLKDRHIIIVEDIVDSGLSLQYLIEMIREDKPASIATCILLDKPEAHKTNIKIDYLGFSIGNDFVVGYGLDYAEKYRNLPFIGVLKEEIYS